MTAGLQLQAWVSALLACVLSFASPKESSQRKGDPEGGAGFAGPLRYSAGRAAAELGLRPQTVLAEGPRPTCVAQHLPRGPQRRPCSSDVAQKTDSHGQPEKTAKNEFRHLAAPTPSPSLPRPRHTRDSASRRAKRESRMLDSRLRANDRATLSPRIVSPGPLRGAEQRRNAGGLRRGLFEGRSPEFSSRPAFRVAQGTGAAGTDPGSPSFCLLFLGEARKSETPRKGGNPSQSGTPCQSSGRKP